MQFKRMFTTDAYRGTRGYLRTQKIYEILRTVIYFAISLSLFIAGWVSTGSRENLLTIVAVLGCLPACKSLVEMFMFLRYRGCDEQVAAKSQHIQKALPLSTIWYLLPMRRIMLSII